MTLWNMPLPKASGAFNARGPAFEMALSAPLPLRAILPLLPTSLALPPGPASIRERLCRCFDLGFDLDLRHFSSAFRSLVFEAYKLAHLPDLAR